MKQLIYIALLIPVLSFSQSDEQQVKDVILKAYVNAIHNGGPIQDIQEGFHHTFQMIRFNNNGTSSTSIGEWISNIETSRKQNSNPPAVKTEARFLSVLISGNSANVALELYRGDKKLFTDHLLLYKFEEGWKIVTKTFYRHP